MVTYNDFFYNMLQAGEVAEITIFPGEDRENRALILLKQGAMYKVSHCVKEPIMTNFYMSSTIGLFKGGSIPNLGSYVVYAGLN